MERILALALRFGILHGFTASREIGFPGFLCHSVVGPSWSLFRKIRAEYPDIIVLDYIDDSELLEFWLLRLLRLLVF